MTPSNDALNRWIAEKLEPKPEWPDHDKGLSMAVYPSAGGCWEGGYGANGWHQDPIDFCVDPACTVMLMEKGRLNVMTNGFLALGGPWVAMCGDGKQAYGDTVGYAVALAFAKANGYREEG